jgi:6-pyruvoyltetrahydropterin/6-carboxytetrahydropterin synthase
VIKGGESARMTWKVLVEHGNLEFSSAHFITFAGECEPLHGHNYGVRVEAEGPLTPDSFVLDFTILKEIARTLAKEWDHRFLLPLRNPHLRIAEQDDAWEVEFIGATAADFLEATGRIRYVLPKWSVVALPIDNATAERLAELFAQRIAARLRERGVSQQLTLLTVGISETGMQTAFYTLDLRELARGERAPDS